MTQNTYINARRRIAAQREKVMHDKHKTIAEIIYGDVLVYHRVVPIAYGRFTA